ncbi:MAG: bifunctional 3-deoxy-7-phosphoheptulonate synthase/chorismate mutase type II [Bernardetiaceae bacterium]|nr:bifunctional 3-deoxy-7-phosphoheptulonate synthase/chorismate mutase type II [Bernardetiaceae bacterium]
MKFISLNEWGVFPYNLDKPLFIAGPCSAETPEQLEATYGGIKAEGNLVAMLRAGVWKPRTRPNSFEGVGAESLPWLVEMRQKFGMPITIEVANPAHVRIALEHKVDVLWLGARSTVNPFTVQEIADELEGIDIPVMVKNPINPDLELWVGAIERLYNAGIRRIAAIHRGFSTHSKSKYRNEPMWQIPLELKSRYPDLPLICDPSHIGGTRELIAPVCQKAMDLNYEGLMIETHCNPDEAWSDAKQQITPQRLGEVLNGLQIRGSSSDNPEFIDQLAVLREKIDRIDKNLIEDLSMRMKLVTEIGDYKKANNVAVFQVERWIEVFQSRPEWAEKLGLSKDFTAQIYKLIHDESIRVQTTRQ